MRLNTSANSRNKRSRQKYKTNNTKITSGLLYRVLEHGSRGKYANRLVYYLAEHIITNKTTIEVSLAILLPRELADILIYYLRRIQDIRISAERTILDILIPSIYIVQKVLCKVVSFTMPKFKFSYLESCIILVSKLIITLAILKNEHPSHIRTLRKKLKI